LQSTFLKSYSLILLTSNKHFESLYLDGKISLELIPQGTLVGRLRAHAAGMPAFFTPTGASTAVEHGSIPIRYNEGGFKSGVKIPGNKKEAREFNGRRYLMEPGIKGDVAFIRAWKVDEVGNCVFRCVIVQSVLFEAKLAL
jgi:3-oxoacid CoA-transferase